LELERIFQGPTWSFVALEAELLKPDDFKSTFVGATGSAGTGDFSGFI
jgi:anthranilate 1,2-dioxygenase large subunit